MEFVASSVAADRRLRESFRRGRQLPYSVSFGRSHCRPSTLVGQGTLPLAETVVMSNPPSCRSEISLYLELTTPCARENFFMPPLPDARHERYGLALTYWQDRARYQPQPVSMPGSSTGVRRAFRSRDSCVRTDLCCSMSGSRQSVRVWSVARVARRYGADSSITSTETRKLHLTTLTRLPSVAELGH
jgi:hypothetical protein